MVFGIMLMSSVAPRFLRSERGSVIEPPAGFEDCEHEDWLYNATTQEFFSKKTGALAWLNAGIFCPIRSLASKSASPESWERIGVAA